jgi:hypothetical protein
MLFGTWWQAQDNLRLACLIRFNDTTMGPKTGFF